MIGAFPSDAERRRRMPFKQQENGWRVQMLRTLDGGNAAVTHTATAKTLESLKKIG